MRPHARYLSAAATLSLMLIAAPILSPIKAVATDTTSGAQSKSSSARSPYASISSGTYATDPQHSSINFSIRHLLVNNVRGRFADYTTTITYNADDITRSSVEFTAKVASVDTDVAKRDAHLRTADFFDVATYPEMTFKSTRIERKSEKAFVAHGDFTLRGVRKQVAIPFTVVGAIADPWGGTRIGVEAALTINRLDYGVKFNEPMANGRLVIGNDVRIELLLEAVKQEPAKTPAAQELQGQS